MSKHVYIATCGDNYKVGISKNPKQRMKELQTGNPKEVKLLDSWVSNDPHRAEKHLHSYLNDSHTNGEWFSDCDVKIGLITELCCSFYVDKVALWLDTHPIEADIAADFVYTKICNDANSFNDWQHVKDLRDEVQQLREELKSWGDKCQND